MLLVYSLGVSVLYLCLCVLVLFCCSGLVVVCSVVLFWWCKYEIVLVVCSNCVTVSSWSAVVVALVLCSGAFLKWY